MSSSVLETLNDIFLTIIDDDDVSLTKNTTADDVEDWDSLNHITFIVAIEKKFVIKFTNYEVNRWENVGDIIDSILSKIEK